MEKESRNWVLVCVAAVIIVFVGYIACCSQESRVFNKLTGADTTTMDAMFVQLRVIEPVQIGGE